MKNPKPRPDGYVRVTVGPKGNGTRALQHRVKAGVGPSSKDTKVVVDHKSGIRSDNSKKNLRVVSRSKNNSNRHGSKYPR